MSAANSSSLSRLSDDLGEGAHLWVVRLDEQGCRDSMVSLLAPDELHRARQFKGELLRQRYIFGRAALRVLLGVELQLDAGAVPLELGPHGKPRLACDARIEFNLSHCGDVAVIGIAEDTPIGVDIERSSGVRDARRLAARFFDAYETEVIEALPSELADAAFLRCWTCKEAVLKALGVGLTWRPSEVVLEPDPRRALRLLRVRDEVAPHAWTLHELCLCDGRMVVSVALAAENARLGAVRRFRFADWLG